MWYVNSVVLSFLYKESAGGHIFLFITSSASRSREFVTSSGKPAARK